MKKALIYYISEEKVPVKWKELTGEDLKINIFEKMIGLYEGSEKMIFAGPLEKFSILLKD